MQMNLKKLWLIAALTCTSFFSTVNAQSYGNNSQPTNPMSQDTSKKGNYQRGSYREITPNAGPRVTNGADVFLTADFIWWKAVQEGTFYAASGIGPGAMATSDTIRSVESGVTRSSGNDWAPGFKVGLGLNLGHDGWDIYTEYTWLRPSNRSVVSREYDATTGEGVVSLQTPNTNDGPYGGTLAQGDLYRWDKASSRWSLRFNVIDLELGRNFYLSQFLTMRPFIGLKGTWQSQTFNTRLSLADGVDIAFSPQVLNAPLSGPYRIKYDNDVWGIGIRGGFNIGWYLTKNWSFYGNTAWTSMWAAYTDLNRKDVVKNSEELGNGISPKMVHVDGDNYYSSKWIGEIELGLRWEMWFYDDNYHFAIELGWEHQVWLNWTSFQSIIQPDRWEDLNFQGLNLKLRFDF